MLCLTPSGAFVHVSSALCSGCSTRGNPGSLAGTVLLLRSSWPLVEGLLSSTHLAASPVSYADLAVVSPAVLLVPQDPLEDAVFRVVVLRAFLVVRPLAAASLVRRRLLLLLHPRVPPELDLRPKDKGVDIWDRCGTGQRSSSWSRWCGVVSLFLNHLSLSDEEDVLHLSTLQA